MSEKLKVADQARLSAKASLKTAERQAEDQHQKLHLTEIDLVTQKQLVAEDQGKSSTSQGSSRG